MGFSQGQCHAALLRAGGVVELAANFLAAKAQAELPSDHSAAEHRRVRSGNVITPAGCTLPGRDTKFVQRPLRGADTIIATPSSVDAGSIRTWAGEDPAASAEGGHTQASQQQHTGVQRGMLSPSLEHDGASSTDISDVEDESTLQEGGADTSASTNINAIPGSLFPVYFPAAVTETETRTQDCLDTVHSTLVVSSAEMLTAHQAAQNAHRPTSWQAGAAAAGTVRLPQSAQGVSAELQLLDDSSSQAMAALG